MIVSLSFSISRAGAVAGVSIQPGSTQFAWMSWRPSSTATERTNAFSPPFVAA